LISDYREMLAKRRNHCPSTADDAESAPDVPTPTGRDQHSSPSSSRSRPTYRPAAMSSGTAVAMSRRRLAGHYRPRTPTSSPEPDDQSQAASTWTAEAPAAVHGKTHFKYKRVKDSVRQPQKRHVLTGRKSDTRQEGIFD